MLKKAYEAGFMAALEKLAVSPQWVGGHVTNALNNASKTPGMIDRLGKFNNNMQSIGSPKAMQTAQATRGLARRAGVFSGMREFAADARTGNKLPPISGTLNARPLSAGPRMPAGPSIQF